MNDLVGEKIVGVGINPQHTLILFRTNKGDLYYKTIGDCCSESWIEHIGPIDDIVGKTVMGVEKTEIGGLPGTKQESDILYCVTLKIDGEWKDTWSLEFRNSSNGYYGGEMSRTGQYGEEITDEEKEEVKILEVNF